MNVFNKEPFTDFKSLYSSSADSISAGTGLEILLTHFIEMRNIDKNRENEKDRFIIYYNTILHDEYSI